MRAHVVVTDYSSSRTGTPCTALDLFEATTVAEGLARDVAHTIRYDIETLDDVDNDVVRVFVDGALVFTGHSWEDYFRDCEPPGSRTVTA